jgi:hypothetical protein
MKSLVRSLRNLGVGAGLLLCGGLVADPALADNNADTITYNFLGTVTSVGPGLPQNEFSVGQSISGSITVDRKPTGKNNGKYAIEDFTVTLSDFTATMWGSCGQVHIQNVRAPLPEMDQFSVRVYCLAGEDPDEILPEDPRSFTLNLRGRSDIFSRNKLPDAIPNVGVFTELNQFSLVFEGPGRAVTGVVNSVSSSR